MTNYKNYFKELINARLQFEVYTIGGNLHPITIGLKCGEGKIARELGFERKDVMEALDWAEENPKIALKLLGF